MTEPALCIGGPLHLTEVKYSEQANFKIPVKVNPEYYRCPKQDPRTKLRKFWDWITDAPRKDTVQQNFFQEDIYRLMFYVTERPYRRVRLYVHDSIARNELFCYKEEVLLWADGGDV